MNNIPNKPGNYSVIITYLDGSKSHEKIKLELSEGYIHHGMIAWITADLDCSGWVPAENLFDVLNAQEIDWGAKD